MLNSGRYLFQISNIISYTKFGKKYMYEKRFGIRDSGNWGIEDLGNWRFWESGIWELGD
jgi:hypothetical protein